MLCSVLGREVVLNDLFRQLRHATSTGDDEAQASFRTLSCAGKPHSQSSITRSSTLRMNSSTIQKTLP